MKKESCRLFQRLFPHRKKVVVPPTPQEIKASLAAVCRVLGTSKDLFVNDDVRRCKIFRVNLAFTSAEEKIEVTSQLYRDVSGRDADLQQEAPQIVAAIREEYGFSGDHGSQAPDRPPSFDFIKKAFDDMLQETVHIVS